MHLFPCSVLNIYVYVSDMNQFGRRNTEEMYYRTDMAANLSEHDIFVKANANAQICELTNKSAATLGNRKSIILLKKQGLFLLFK